MGLYYCRTKVLWMKVIWLVNLILIMIVWCSKRNMLLNNLTKYCNKMKKAENNRILKPLTFKIKPSKIKVKNRRKL